MLEELFFIQGRRGHQISKGLFERTGANGVSKETGPPSPSPITRRSKKCELLCPMLQEESTTYLGCCLHTEAPIARRSAACFEAYRRAQPPAGSPSRLRACFSRLRARLAAYGRAFAAYGRALPPTGVHRRLRARGSTSTRSLSLSLPFWSLSGSVPRLIVTVCLPVRLSLSLSLSLSSLSRSLCSRSLWFCTSLFETVSCFFVSF